MAEVNDDIVVRIGGTARIAESQNPVVEHPAPYVEWDLPPTLKQKRFSVRISNAEPAPNGWAYTTSGLQVTDEQHFQFPDSVQLNDNFAGLCSLEVAVSANDSGDLEYVSPPLYFVYDRRAEKLFSSEQVKLQWATAGDPDDRPHSESQLFNVQISTDVLFNTVVYDKEIINIDNLPRITLEIPSEEFNPAEPTTRTGKKYFWRVRGFDGVDYSEWSVRNAFINYTVRPPKVTITAVEPTFNEHGDIRISFLVEDVDGDAVSVEFSYLHEALGQQRKPCRIINNLGHISAGSHAVTWRALRNDRRAMMKSLVVYARAYDGVHFSEESFWGPIDIDHSVLIKPSGGIGSAVYTFAVQGAAGIKRSITAADDLPATVHFTTLPNRETFISLFPVSHWGFVFPKAFSMCPVERVNDLDGEAPDRGWGSTESPVLQWPLEVITNTTGPARAYLGRSMDQELQKINPHTDDLSFIFLNPTNYATMPDAWPRPTQSRLLNLQSSRYLHGYLDMDGHEVAYPDGYDFDQRPSWHNGREVWRYGDAWVQMGTVEYTSFKPCQTCKGRHWLPSPHAPYHRLPCTNNLCVDGFDVSKPYTKARNPNPDNRPDPWIVKAYSRPRWVRLSSAMMRRPLELEDRIGLVAQTGQINQMTQHIVGRGISTVEGVTDWVYDQAGNRHKELRWYQTIGMDRTLRLPPATSVLWNRSSEHNLSTTLTRQPDDAAGVTGYAKPGIPPAVDMDMNMPVLGGLTKHVTLGPDHLPAQGIVAPPKSPFFWGSDPETSPGHAIRPTPTQVAGVRVVGEMGRDYPASSLQFRFLHSYWDAYETLHWQMTGSETSKVHLQYTRVYDDGHIDEWRDVTGDNGTLDEETDCWLVDPLVFETFWDTSSRTLFVDGGRYQLRLRQYDPLSRTFNEWIHSNVFSIISGVTNPVTIMSLGYEPWTKSVLIKLRVDSTTGLTYNLTAFWYSDGDGMTWRKIPKGDIAGNIVALSSKPGENIYDLRWIASSYGLRPGFKYRLKIEALPTGVADEIVLPNFKWVVPINPFLDAAEYTLRDVMGSVEHVKENPQTGRMEPVNPPVFKPGRLAVLENEFDRIRAHPGQKVGPLGIFSFIAPNPSGNILVKSKNQAGQTIYVRYGVVDEDGYKAWLDEPYQGSLSHREALQNVSAQIDQLARVVVPQAKAQILESQRICRQDLMDQGYYAEQHFPTIDGRVEEIIRTKPVFIEDPDTVDDFVERYWRFKVMTVAEGSGVYRPNGQFAPQDITPLETAFYEWQMDPTGDFNSQPHRQPLRAITRDDTGHRLRVASMSTPPVSSDTNTHLDQVDNPQNAPWNGKITTTDVDFGRRQGQAATSANPVTYFTGSLTLRHNQLPGEASTDHLPDGREAWRGEYQWRVAAYNPVVGPVTARPRPEITSLELVDSDTLAVNYVMRGHPQLTSASMASGLTPSYWWYTPSLENDLTLGDVTQLDFVSDRRASDHSATFGINPPWVPAGVDRPHPWAGFDDETMQYFVFTSKKAYDGRWRIVGSRGVCLPQVCEYDVYFTSHSSLAIYGPSLVKVAGTWWMFMTVQDSIGSTPYIAVATSHDAHSWSTPQKVEGITAGAHPTVLWHDNKFYLWYENMQGGRVKIFMATSTNGTDFTAGNAGATVLVDTVDTGSPSVVRVGDAFQMFYNRGNEIFFATSADGATFTSPTWLLSPAGPKIQLNAHAYWDWFMGNRELYVMYNRREVSGDHHIHFGRVEQRFGSWTAGLFQHISGDAGHMTNVPVTVDGTPRQLRMKLQANGITNTSQLKVRINFTQWGPQTCEFRRRSRWSTPPLDDPNSTMYPTVWSYHEQLAKLPYIT